MATSPRIYISPYLEARMHLHTSRGLDAAYLPTSRGLDAEIRSGERWELSQRYSAVGCFETYSAVLSCSRCAPVASVSCALNPSYGTRWKDGPAAETMAETMAEGWTGGRDYGRDYGRRTGRRQRLWQRQRRRSQAHAAQECREREERGGW